MLKVYLIMLFSCLLTFSMFPTIDNNRGVAAVKSAPDSRTISSSSTECAIEALEICLCLI